MMSIFKPHMSPSALEELKAHGVCPPALGVCPQSLREGEDLALNITTSVWPHPLCAAYDPQIPEGSDRQEVLIIPDDADVQYYTRIDNMTHCYFCFSLTSGTFPQITDTVENERFCLGSTFPLCSWDVSRADI